MCDIDNFLGSWFWIVKPKNAKDLPIKLSYIGTSLTDASSIYRMLISDAQLKVKNKKQKTNENPKQWIILSNTD